MALSVLQELVEWTRVIHYDIKISAMPRKKLNQLNRMDSQIATMAEHLCKRLIIIDEQNYNGWERTIRNCADNIRRYRKYSSGGSIKAQEILPQIENESDSECNVWSILSYYCEKGNILFCYYYKCDNTELYDTVVEVIYDILDEALSDKNWTAPNALRNKKFREAISRFSKKEIDTFEDS